jgi:ribosome-binding protein aMBF1 (putative translation factor)
MSAEKDAGPRWRILGWSQRELARRADVSNKTVARVESGDNTPNRNTMRTLEAVLTSEETRPLPPGGTSDA